jgi:salicylate hydroxylase
MWVSIFSVMSQTALIAAFVGQRADLLDMLHTLAKPYMTLRLNSKVVSIDPRAATATLETGERFSGDLIIGADGIKSIVRGAVVGGPTRAPIHTGDSAYRSVIPTAGMLADPDLKGLVESSEMISWMGPGESPLLRKTSVLFIGE